MKKNLLKSSLFLSFFISFLVLDSSAINPSAIQYDFLIKLPVSKGSINVENLSGITLGNGSLIAYKTNEGRFGVVEIAQNSSILKINYVTYNADKTIAKEGKDISISSNNYFDFDLGIASTSPTGADFFYFISPVNASLRNIAPVAGSLYLIKSSLCIGNVNTITSIPYNKITSYPLSMQTIETNNSYNKLPVGTQVAFKTIGLSI